MGVPWKTRQAGYSAHAVARMQQRGIREDAVDLLFRYGREEHDHRGRTIIYFDKAARRRMRREMGCPHSSPQSSPHPSLPTQAGEEIDKSPPSRATGGIGKRPRAQAKEGLLNLRIYAVLGRSGDIVTVGHRYARIRRY